MLRGTDVNQLSELKQEGLGIQAISELTGYDPKTVRKYLMRPKRCRSTRREQRKPANWTLSSRS